MEYELIEVAPDQVDEFKPAVIALHRFEVDVQPALGHAPARSDEEFWRVYRAWFGPAYARGDGFVIAAKSPAGEILGFVFGVVKDGELGFDNGERAGYVEDIAVLDNARGLGIGKALMEGARSQFAARGLTSYKLSTVPGNDDARAFYASLGLEPAAQLLIGEVQDPRRD